VRSRERGSISPAVVITIGLVVLAALAAGIYLMIRRPADTADREAVPSAPAPRVERKAAPPAAPAPAPPAERKGTSTRRAAPAPAPAAEAPAAPTLATLVLESDVAGASVFINREYVGTTPLTLDRLEPGTKQIKLTADGYEGIERSVDLVAGDNPVTMRFKEVRLNKRLAVTHKHGMGSCEGALVATLDGLAYQTSNKGDAFNLPWDRVELLAVDYLDKNLRVKQRSGRTWNFTDKAAANADALFVFQRDVEAARKKLAAGYAPVK
jgi:hypothetical protein